MLVFKISSAAFNNDDKFALLLKNGGYEVRNLNKFVGALETNSKHSIGRGVSSSGPRKRTYENYHTNYEKKEIIIRTTKDKNKKKLL